MSQIHRGQLALLMGLPQLVLEAANSALQLSEQAASRSHAPGAEASLSSQVLYPARSSVWAYWLLGTAHIDLGHLVEAETFLTQALTRCRQINLVELEPDILLSWARWHRMNALEPIAGAGAREQARECAEEALSIAVRSEYRLKEAEIQNFLAQWDMDMEQVANARKHAERAKQCAWCDGPPHCYRIALDEAEGLLELIESEDL
jgi:tetratricopeptide (TPR) repeat protein